MWPTIESYQDTIKQRERERERELMTQHSGSSTTTTREPGQDGNATETYKRRGQHPEKNAQDMHQTPGKPENQKKGREDS